MKRFFIFKRHRSRGDGDGDGKDNDGKGNGGNYARIRRGTGRGQRINTNDQESGGTRISGSQNERVATGTCISNSDNIVVNPKSHIWDLALHRFSFFQKKMSFKDTSNMPTARYIASSHVLVNNARASESKPQLRRRRSLDNVAKMHAKAMAERGEAVHSKPKEIQSKLNRPCRLLGENVGKGPNPYGIHLNMMKTVCDKNNILDRRFTQIGVGTATANDGTIFLCQIFRG